jgi:arylsulfatase A
LSDLAGWRGRLPAIVDGGSFRAVLERGGVGRVRRPFEGLVFHSPFMNAHSAIRAGDYKLVKLWDTGNVLLFNLRDDLGETKDLAATRPQKRDQLHRLLIRYLDSVNAEKFGLRHAANVRP